VLLKVPVKVKVEPMDELPLPCAVRDAAPDEVTLPVPENVPPPLASVPLTVTCPDCETTI
jgi:hypothetical protein